MSPPLPSALELGLLIPSGSSHGEVLEGGPVGRRGAGLVGPWEAGTGWRRAKRTPDKGVRRQLEGKHRQEGVGTETEEENKSQCPDC